MMGTKMYEEYADHVKINVWVELFDLNAEFFYYLIILVLKISDKGFETRALSKK